MTVRLLLASMTVASVAVLVFLAYIALTPNPTAPMEPRTWPSTPYADSRPPVDLSVH